MKSTQESAARANPVITWLPDPVRSLDEKHRVATDQRTAIALSLVVLGFPFPERRRREHSDPTKRIQDQQILIAGNDRGALAGQRRRQHHIVIAVATNRWLECVRFHEREGLRKQPKSVPRIDVAVAELSREDVAQLVEEWAGRNDNVMSDAVFQQLTADAARDQRGDQDIRIEEQLHETRVNTSSSV